MLETYQNNSYGGGSGKLNTQIYKYHTGDKHNKCLVFMEHYERWKCVFGEGWDLYYLLFGAHTTNTDLMLILPHFVNALVGTL